MYELPNPRKRILSRHEHLFHLHQLKELNHPYEALKAHSESNQMFLGQLVYSSSYNNLYDNAGELLDRLKPLFVETLRRPPRNYGSYLHCWATPIHRARLVLLSL